MVMTREQARAAMTHILDNVLNLPPQSPVHSALERAAIFTPIDLVTLDRGEFEELLYTDGDGEVMPLPKGYAGLLRGFQAFILYKRNNGTPLGENTWATLTDEEFNEFRLSPNFYTGGASPSVVLSGPQTFSDPLKEFRRGIKRDITHFISLKDDGAWDNWQRATMAQARAQDVADVLDPNYKPNTPAETMLFDKKQKYMYAVFEKTLLTDKGKALVRNHQRKYNAQLIYKELSEYALQSTKASLDASSLLTYLTTNRLGDGKWKGTTHAFILHWQDQVRKYHDLAPKQKLPTDLQRTMLENAVHPIPALRIIKTQAEQHKAHTGLDLSYSQYSALLLSAAQQHDKLLMGTPGRYPKRQVYQMEQQDEESNYSIDSPIDYLSINQSITNNPRPPRMSYDKWQRLPDDAKQTWDLLSDEAKAIILGTMDRKPNQPMSAPPPRRRVNQHDIQHLVSCLHKTGFEDHQTLSTVSTSLHAQSEGSNDNQSFQDNTLTPEDHSDTPPNDQQLLAHLTKRKSLPPGTAKRLMSPTAGAPAPRSNPSTNNNQQEINFNGSVY